MMHAVRDPLAPATGRHGPAPWLAVITALSLAIVTATASVPISNELGVRFKVVAAGPTTVIEVRLTPRRSFDTVRVEAASGVASLAPPCAFSNVVAGGSYVCRVDLTGKPSDPAMTLNVVAQSVNPGGGVPEMEIHHLSVRNASFVRSKKSQAASHHVVTGSATTSR